ncbi:MAG: hypothetical protein PHO67_07855 [Candidatus Omnitrophica bacterium]|nr:hypothetical protein [Candidatus Omnitrophota bacterium]
MNKQERQIALDLLKKKNVVAVGRGTKKTDGTDTRQPAIVVSVARKVPLSALSKRDRVPVVIKGRRTDVVEVGGEIKLRLDEPRFDKKRETMRKGHQVVETIEHRRLGYTMRDITARERPAHPGCSIGHKDITAGTFGAVVYENQSGTAMILSNNHVLANVNKGKVGDSILQQGYYDGGREPGDVIATLDDFVEIETVNSSDCPLTKLYIKMGDRLARIFGSRERFTSYRSATNKVDCALALPVDPADIDPFIPEIGSVTGVAAPEVGMEVMKRGRTTEITRGKINSIDNIVNVNMGDGDYAIFEDQVIISGIGGQFSAGGDSGSLILDKQRRAVCLLFAGNDTITIGNDIRNVLEALDVRLMK